MIVTRHAQKISTLSPSVVFCWLCALLAWPGLCDCCGLLRVHVLVLFVLLSDDRTPQLMHPDSPNVCVAAPSLLWWGVPFPDELGSCHSAGSHVRAVVLVWIPAFCGCGTASALWLLVSRAQTQSPLTAVHLEAKSLSQCHAFRKLSSAAIPDGTVFAGVSCCRCFCLIGVLHVVERLLQVAQLHSSCVFETGHVCIHEVLVGSWVGG